MPITNQYRPISCKTSSLLKPSILNFSALKLFAKVGNTLKGCLMLMQFLSLLLEKYEQYFEIDLAGSRHTALRNAAKPPAACSWNYFIAPQ